MRGEAPHSKSRGERLGLKALLFSIPCLWLLVFLVAPLVLILATSVAHQGPYGTFRWGWTWEHFVRLGDPLYGGVIWDSIILSGVTTLTCLVLAYPWALIMATASSKQRWVLQVATMVPFFANFVVRIQSIKWLLSVEGILNDFLIAIGVLSEPMVMMGTSVALYVGMVINYIPGMILPLYATLRDFDFELLDAAQDLGASRFYGIYTILWPLSLKGVLAGCLLVFIPCVGEFLIPDLLGGGRTMLLGGLITSQFVKWRHWPFGAALSVMMIAGALGAIALSEWLGRATRHGVTEKKAPS